LAGQQLLNEGKLNIIHPSASALATTPGIIVTAPPPQPVQQPFSVNKPATAATPSSLASSSSSASPSPVLNIPQSMPTTTPQPQDSQQIGKLKKYFFSINLDKINPNLF